jgi:hypothetical protein
MIIINVYKFFFSVIGTLIVLYAISNCNYGIGLLGCFLLTIDIKKN